MHTAIPNRVSPSGGILPSLYGGNRPKRPVPAVRGRPVEGCADQRRIFAQRTCFAGNDLLQAAGRTVPAPTTCGRGGIGRRAALRSLWGNPWKFESSRPHQTFSKGFGISAARRLLSLLLQGSLAKRKAAARPRHRLVFPVNPKLSGWTDYAAFFVRASVSATTSPKEAGVGTITTPASFRISTFSCADSPKAEMIAPACPMRRPFGADRPAM